jgi:hypothetical protein
MAITGQFGRAVTGSGSLASAISSAASEYANIRVDRIYKAFLNEEAFEGRTMDGKTAIELLKQMQKRASKNSRTGLNIADTINDVRKSDRNRTINRINSQIQVGGAAGGDYYKKVQALREMLMDPTLSSDDRSELETDLGEAVDNFLINARNQYGDGSSITVNGQTVNFASGANSATLMGYYDQFINEMPSMADKLTRERFKTQAAIYVSEGSAAYNGSTRTTDGQKRSGYQAQLVYLQKAYDLLVQNGMKDDELAETILGNIRTVEGNIKITGENIAGEKANTRYEGAVGEVYGFINSLQDAILAAMPSAAMYLGTDSFAKVLRDDPNAALNFIEAYKAGTGLDTIEIDGVSHGLSPEDLTSYILDAKAGAKDLYNWSKKNGSLSVARKAEIRDLYNGAVTLATNAPRLKAEDAYDNAQDKLTSALDAAGSNYADRAAAVKAYATELNRIGGLYGMSDPGLKRLFANEANLFLGNGNFDATMGVYGTDSANYSDFLGDTTGISQALGGSDEEISLVDALKDFWKKVDAYNGGLGDGTDEGGSSLDPDALEDYTDGNGIRLVGSRPRDVGDGEVLTSENTWYKRYRIMLPGYQSDTTKDGIKNGTLGWVTMVNGKYVVFYQNSDGNSELIDSELAQTIFQGGLKLTTWNGIQIIEASTIPGVNGKTIREVLEGADSELVTDSELAAGGTALRKILEDKNYQWVYTDAAQTQYESLLAAVRDGHVEVTTRGTTGGRKVRISVIMDDGTIIDISNEFNTDAWTIINTNYVELLKDPDPIGRDGGAENASYSDDGTDSGANSWAGTQYDGMAGTTVIGKDASGNDLTLAEAYSGGTGFMWADPVNGDGKPGGNGGGNNGGQAGNNGGGRGAPKPKARPVVQQAAFANRLGVGQLRIPQSDLNESRKIFDTVMRNMPAGTGGTTGNSGIVTKTNTPAVKRRPLGRLQF